MNDKRMTEALLILAEECAEVTQCVSKIMRFGIESYWDGITNREKLSKELGDLYAMIDILANNEIVYWEDVKSNAQNKRKKLYQWSSIFKEEENV